MNRRPFDNTTQVDALASPFLPSDRNGCTNESLILVTYDLCINDDFQDRKCHRFLCTDMMNRGTLYNTIKVDAQASPFLPSDKTNHGL